jgi:hypothetical protein
MARVDRRAFLRTGGRVVVGLAGVLGRAPASWAARELSILTAVNYAPSSDVKLDELAKRFSQAAGVTTRVAHVQSVQMPAKLSAELMAGATRRADPAHHQHLRHPNMFARLVTNASKPKDAILWAETEIRRIVDKK